MTFPILEHDPTREAFIEPSKVIRPLDMPLHCVICFFKDVVDKVVVEHNARVLVGNRWEDGPHPIYEIAYNGKRLALYHPGIGAALTAAIRRRGSGLFGSACRSPQERSTASPSIHRRDEEKLIVASQSLTPQAYEVAKEAGRALTLEQAKVVAACLRP